MLGHGNLNFFAPSACQPKPFPNTEDAKDSFRPIVLDLSGHGSAVAGAHVNQHTDNPAKTLKVILQPTAPTRWAGTGACATAVWHDEPVRITSRTHPRRTAETASPTARPEARPGHRLYR